MIKHRPAYLLDDKAYCVLPKPPFELDWTSIPELIRVSMLDLQGIQPITKAMAEATGGTLRDNPSNGEVELFRKRGTQFQLISVVLSVVPAGEREGALKVKPFAITLVPAEKRNEVEEVSIDYIDKVEVANWLKTEPIYAGYDPFLGEWSLYGNLPGYLDGERKGFLDEIGIVIDQFFLATETGDDEILMMDLRMPSREMKDRYEKHRKNLLFTPFKRPEARRVWGAETAIELFLIQALAKEMLIMSDGATFPSWYHLWQDLEFRHTNGLITSADIYFPTERIAVFCDGTHHARGKQKAKDASVNAKLEQLGILPVRIPSREITLDLARAVSRVTEALAQPR